MKKESTYTIKRKIVVVVFLSQENCGYFGVFWNLRRNNYNEQNYILARQMEVKVCPSGVRKIM